MQPMVPVGTGCGVSGRAGAAGVGAGSAASAGAEAASGAGAAGAGGSAPPASKRQRVSVTDQGARTAAAFAAPLPAVLVREVPSSGGSITGRPHTRSIEDLRWHFPMLNDRERNVKLCTAVESAVALAAAELKRRGVNRGVRVLDIGSGSGLLALAAARAGAEHVTACEADPLVAGAASAISAANGFGHCVKFVAKHSSKLSVSDLRDGQPVDVVTHELLDSTLLGEDVLPALRDAYTRGLAVPGALSVPWGARIEGQLVESAFLRARRHPPASLWSDPSLGGLTAADTPALARAAAECPAGRAAQGVEASAWVGSGPDMAAVSSNRPADWTWASSASSVFEFEFAAPPSAGGRVVECVFECPNGSTGRVDGVVYWWDLYLLQPGQKPISPVLPVNECIAPTVYSTRPGKEWLPCEHWWQAASVLPAPIHLRPDQGEVRLVASHNDATVWFDLATAPDADQQSRKRVAPEVVDGAWNCTCGVHTQWSSQRLGQLADSSRLQRYRKAMGVLLKDAEGNEVVLAFGIWIAVRAARALIERPTASAKGTRVLVIEGSHAGRQLAAEILEAQHPPLPTGLVEIFSADWWKLDLAVDLRGQKIAAVVAEPWFRGTGQSWGPGAAAQLQAMVQATPIRLCLPRSAAVMICGVSCHTLAAGQRPIGAVCEFDLSEFNGLRSSQVQK